MREFDDLKNGLEILNDLGNASSSHETTAILKEEIQFLKEDIKKYYDTEPKTENIYSFKIRMREICCITQL